MQFIFIFLDKSLNFYNLKFHLNCIIQPITFRGNLYNSYSYSYSYDLDILEVTNP